MTKKTEKNPIGREVRVREKFEALRAHLAQLGISDDKLDMDLLWEYARTLHDILEVRAILQQDGWVVQGSKGMMAHPAEQVLRRAERTAAQLAAVLGLTPKIRSALSKGLDVDVGVGAKSRILDS